MHDQPKKWGGGGGEVKCLLTLGREREGELNKWEGNKMSQWYR